MAKERLTKQALFASANIMRGAMEPSDYKHVALGLLFLRHISERFDARYLLLSTEEGANPEDRDEYVADNIFWVPTEARWSLLSRNSKDPKIGVLIDRAMQAIERENKALQAVLPKNFARPELSAIKLGELVDLFTNMDLTDETDSARDVLGEVYEYFLSEFAGAEGKRGGEFYTPRSVVRLLVEMLEPLQGRVYDPCCGSGGMFTLSEEFVESHGGRLNDLSIWGQEMNHTTWRLCKMNLAIRGIDSDIVWNSEGTFHDNAFPHERFDYVMANPPFNISGWGAKRVAGDVRWKYGMPPDGNANYAWLQHIIHHLAPNGTAGIVLANGSMSSEQSGEGAIRRALVEGVWQAGEDDAPPEMIVPGVVDCMVALPGQLFNHTQIPACLWFLAKSRKNGKFIDRSGEILFIDAREFGHMTDRTHRTFSDEDIAEIAGTYHKWREGATGDDGYVDVPGFCRSVPIYAPADGGISVEGSGWVLTPGRYVGVTPKEDDDPRPFSVKFAELREQLAEHRAEAKRLDAAIIKALESIREGEDG